jgi:hypothetical protein
MPRPRGSRAERDAAERRPRERRPVERAARDLLAEEEILVEDRHRAEVVGLGTAAGGVPVLEPRGRRDDERPASRHAVREVEVLAERVAAQALVELELGEHFPPEAHVAAGERLDRLHRRRRQEIARRPDA